MTRKRPRNIPLWIAAILGLLVDRLTKFWVMDNFDLTNPPESIPLWPGVFHFTYVTNTGAAFSLFEGSGWLRWLSLLVSVGLMLMAWFGPRLPFWQQIGYGFVLAGAIGNGIDRFATGEVVDFLDFRLINFPVFNVADICINIGIVCLLIAAWRSPGPH